MSRLIDFRDAAREKIVQRLKIRLHYLTSQNADVIRNWLKVSERHEVTARDAFNYIDHRYKENAEAQENWDLMVYLLPVGAGCLVEIIEGGVCEGYTDQYLGPYLDDWDEVTNYDMPSEPLEVEVSSRAWLNRAALLCI